MRALIGWLAWRVYCWATFTRPEGMETLDLGRPGRKKEYVQGLLDSDEGPAWCERDGAIPVATVPTSHGSCSLHLELTRLESGLGIWRRPPCSIPPRVPAGLALVSGRTEAGGRPVVLLGGAA